MIKPVSLFLFLVLPFAHLRAQDSDPCPCCTPEHHQFDFWLGKWMVYDSLGNKVGENVLISMQDSCLIQENWRGTRGGTGTSYNYFDRTNNTWNQLWIDNEGSALKLKGNMNGNVMVLVSEPVEADSSIYRNRITWEPLEDGSVVQTWDAINESGSLLKRLFKGIYIKEKNLKVPESLEPQGLEALNYQPYKLYQIYQLTFNSLSPCPPKL